MAKTFLLIGYFFVALFVIIFLQGPSFVDLSATDLYGGFYRPLVGGDEAYWDAASQSLTFSIDTVSSLSFYEFFLGYLDIGGRYASSSFYLFYLSFLNSLTLQNPSLTLILKYVFSCFVIFALYCKSVKNLNYAKKDLKIMYCCSFSLLIVSIHPFFLWLSHSFLRDDLIVLLVSLTMYIYCLHFSCLLDRTRYLFIMLLLCIIALNFRPYLVSIPLIMLFSSLFVDFALNLLRNYRLSVYKIFTLLLVTSVLSLFIYISLVYLQLPQFSNVLVATFTGFFRPSVLNVLFSRIYAFEPLRIVYLLHFAFVIIFLFAISLRLLRPIRLNEVLLLLPLILSDLTYRFIVNLSSYDIAGPRQFLAVLPIDLFIFAYLVFPFNRPNSSIVRLTRF